MDVTFDQVTAEVQREEPKGQQQGDKRREAGSLVDRERAEALEMRRRERIRSRLSTH